MQSWYRKPNGCIDAPDSWLMLPFSVSCVLFFFKTFLSKYKCNTIDVIQGFHFADRRLSQLPTSQAVSSSSRNHRAGQRCFCLWESRWWSLKGRNSTVRLCDCDLSCLQLAVLVPVIASYLQSESREWHLSGRSRRTYNLLFCLPWSCTGALSSRRGSMKMLSWTLVSVRNRWLWNVTRN